MALSVVSEKEGFRTEEVISVEHRDNNAKRNFLLVNKHQCKHIPAEYSDFYTLCDAMSTELYNKYGSDIVCNGSLDETLFIGFAETATALGYYTAAAYTNNFYPGLNVMYTITTRDKNYEAAAEKVYRFSEEHSHATEQMLCDYFGIFKNRKSVVFIEDEISTGKTIMNIVKTLREDKAITAETSVYVISVLNGMSDESLAVFERDNIHFAYLSRIKATPDSSEVYHYTEPSTEANLSDTADSFYRICLNKIPDTPCDSARGVFVPCSLSTVYSFFSNSLFRDEALYMCQVLRPSKKGIRVIGTVVLEKFLRNMVTSSKKGIRVIGTEEEMASAIAFANLCKEELNLTVPVKSHSATRSPIVPFNVITDRHALESAYDSERTVYLYNLNNKEDYDTVVVVTSGSNAEGFTKSLISCINDSRVKVCLIRIV